MANITDANKKKLHIFPILAKFVIGNLVYKKRK